MLVAPAAAAAAAANFCQLSVCAHGLHLLQANAPAFYAVDISKPLGSQLAGKTIIEFPILVSRGQVRLIC